MKFVVATLIGAVLAGCGTEDIPEPATDGIEFHHVAIIARDFDATVSWYIDNFDFAVAQEWTLPDLLPGARMTYLQRGAMFLEVIGDVDTVGEHIVADDPIADYRITGFRHFAFIVEDVDAVVADLQQRGVQPFFPPADVVEIGLRAALVRDPEGNTVELIQPI